MVFYSYTALPPPSSSSVASSSTTASTPSNTSNSSPTITSSSSSIQKTKSSAGPAVGGAVGGIAILVLAMVAGWYLMRRRRSRARYSTHLQYPAPRHPNVLEGNELEYKGGQGEEITVTPYVHQWNTSGSQPTLMKPSYGASSPSIATSLSTPPPLQENSGPFNAQHSVPTAHLDHGLLQDLMNHHVPGPAIARVIGLMAGEQEGSSHGGSGAGVQQGQLGDQYELAPPPSYDSGSADASNPAPGSRVGEGGKRRMP